MLKMASATTTSPFAPRAKVDIGDSENSYPVVLETDVAEPVELVDEMLSSMDGGDTSREHSQEVTADFAGDDYEQDAHSHAKHKAFAQEFEDYDEDDSDYAPHEEEEEESDEEEEEEEEESEDDDDETEELQALADSHAEEMSDFYVKRMLETRDQLEGEEAQWVDRYILAQREWKETHGSSIDEMDRKLYTSRKNSKSTHKNQKNSTTNDTASKPLKETPWEGRAGDEQDEDHASSSLFAVAEALNGRVSPILPAPLRNQPTEFLVSLVAVVLFVGVALAVQFYVAFKPPLYS